MLKVDSKFGISQLILLKSKNHEKDISRHFLYNDAISRFTAWRVMFEMGSF